MSLLRSFQQLLKERQNLPHGRKAISVLESHLSQKPSLKFRETWRYNSLINLEVSDFKQPEPSASAPSEQERAWMKDELHNKARHKDSDSHSLCLVFYNGVHQQDLSSPKDSLAKAGIQLLNPSSSFDSVLDDAPDAHGESLFKTLNNALAENGVSVNVPESTQVSQCLHVFHFASGLEDSLALFYRNHLSLGSGSRLRVVHHYLSTSSDHFTNAFSDIALGRGAELHLAQIELESTTANHMVGCHVGLNEGAVFRLFNYQRGGRHVVNDCRVSFLEPYAKAFLSGINMVCDRSQVDQRTQMRHVVGGCESMQQFRNILKDYGRANFTGNIIVSKDAQKTNADKLNKNFLLSPNAQANSRPELEIHADDVTCTHGSTTGQPDKEQMFYLQSRGLSTEQAVECLAYGFVEEVLLALPHPTLQDELKKDMKQHFFQGATGGF